MPFLLMKLMAIGRLLMRLKVRDWKSSQQEAEEGKVEAYEVSLSRSNESGKACHLHVMLACTCVVLASHFIIIHAPSNPTL